MSKARLLLMIINVSHKCKRPLCYWASDTRGQCARTVQLAVRKQEATNFKVCVANLQLADMFWAYRPHESPHYYILKKTDPVWTQRSAYCKNACACIDLVGVPVLGEEGSHTLDESLYVLETCSDSFFLVLPPALWCFFLFFTKIFPISSIGLGSGTPGSSCKWTKRSGNFTSSGEAWREMKVTDLNRVLFCCVTWGFVRIAGPLRSNETMLTAYCLLWHRGGKPVEWVCRGKSLNGHLQQFKEVKAAKSKFLQTCFHSTPPIKVQKKLCSTWDLQLRPQ